jgi:hypothetical protein
VSEAGRSGSPAVIDHLTGDYAVFAVGLTPNAGSMARVTSAVEGVRAALAPWQAGTCYLNFAEQARSDRQLFDERTLQALRRVKALYDPADLIKSTTK